MLELCSEIVNRPRRLSRRQNRWCHRYNDVDLRADQLGSGEGTATIFSGNRSFGCAVGRTIATAIAEELFAGPPTAPGWGRA